MSQSAYFYAMNRVALFLIATAVCAALFVAIEFALLWSWL
jgi:hypothetical protein